MFIKYTGFKITLFIASILILSGYNQVFAATTNTSISTLSNGSTLNTGLAGYWTFDGKDISGGAALDMSGNGYTGNLFNIATSTFYAVGKIGQAFNFDGSNDAVQFSFPASSITNTGQLTFSAWINTSVSTGVENNVIQLGGDYNTWAIYIDSADAGKPSLSITGNYVTRLLATTNVKNGLWHNVVGTYDGTTASIYIDGVLENSGSKTLTSQSGTLTSRIGSNNSGSDPWSGKIDDVRVYNRALTAAEIKQLYFLGGGTTNASASTLSNGSTLNTGLAGYWTFDGKNMISGKVKDLSGNGYDGSPVNISTSTFYTTGKLGQSLNFNSASSQMVLLPDIDSGITTQLTVSAWIYPTAVEGGYGGIAGTATNGGFMTFTQSNALRCDSVTNNGRVFTATPGVLVNNKWQFITETYDGSFMKCYVDGVVLDSTAQTGTITQQSVGRIGYSGNSTEYFQGKIDDVRVYNRALTAAEIKQLYFLGGGTTNTSASTLGNGSTLNTGLVGYWTFDGKNVVSGTALDKSGNGNTGNLISIASSTFYALGKLGQAFNFDGSDDNINIGDISTFDTTFSAFTVSTWIKPNNTGAEKFIIGKMGNSGQRGWQFAIESDATINLDYFDGASGSEQSVTTVSSVSYNMWTHVVATFSASSEVDIYINGVLNKQQASGVLAVINGSNSAPLTIGNRGSGGSYFSGSIDDTRIYSRALTAAEIKQLYMMGK